MAGYSPDGLPAGEQRRVERGRHDTLSVELEARVDEVIGDLSPVTSAIDATRERVGQVRQELQRHEQGSALPPDLPPPRHDAVKHAAPQPPVGPHL